MPKKRKPPFLSATVMRRAFQARLLSVHPRAQTLRRVQVRRLGGFEDRSFRLRYRLELRLRNGKKHVLYLRGSCELDDQTRRQSYVIMKYLWRHGFDTGPFQVARPVTFFSRWRLLVYEEAAGTPLDRYLRQRPAQSRVIERTALWLVALHKNSPRTLRFEHTKAGRKQYWQKALNLLAKKKHPNQTQIIQRIKKTMAFEDRLAAHPGRVLVHHDFHPGNILVSPKVIRVVDFTESRLSDRLVDVATFLAQLDLQFPSVPVARKRGWQKRFLQTYTQHAKHTARTRAQTKRIFQFMRFRIALQSYIGEYLLGNPNSQHQQLIVKAQW